MKSTYIRLLPVFGDEDPEKFEYGILDKNADGKDVCIMVDVVDSYDDALNGLKALNARQQGGVLSDGEIDLAMNVAVGAIEEFLVSRGFGANGSPLQLSELVERVAEQVAIRIQNEHAAGRVTY